MRETSYLCWACNRAVDGAGAIYETFGPTSYTRTMLCADCARRVMETLSAIRDTAARPATGGREGAVSLCRDCGRLFRSEGPVVCGLDKILCVPCIGAALARLTD